MLKVIYLLKSIMLFSIVIMIIPKGLNGQCYEIEGVSFSISSTGGNQNSEYSTEYILTDYQGEIVEISSNTTFIGQDAGIYKVIAINYLNSDPPANLVVGQNIDDIQSGCFELSPEFLVVICPQGCDIFDGNYTFNATGGNTGLNTKYLLVNTSLNIVDISTSQFFTFINPGDYFVFAINYETMDNLTVGVSIDDLTGSCFDISNPIALASCENCSVNIGGDFEVCEGLEVMLTSSTSGPGGSFLWNTGEVSPNITVTASSTTEYSLTFTDDLGCESIDSILITVLEPPMGSILGDSFICQGESTTLTASGGSSYQWIAGSSASTPEIIVTPDVTTEYSVVVFNSNSCFDTVSITVLVEDCNVDCGYCVGDTVTFSVAGGNSDLSNIFVLTDLNNIIVDTSSQPEFESMIVGEFKIFPINFDGDISTLTGLGQGLNINDVSGTCFDIGSSFIFRVCNCAALGNYVWNDMDVDGTQGVDEEGINGVTVNLYDPNNPTVPLATTVTGENPDDPSLQGYYIFEDLLPGDYYVEFVTPDGFIITMPNSGSAEDADSDIDGTNGEGTTATIKLLEGEVNLDVDGGFVFPVLPVEWSYLKGEWNQLKEVNEICWGTALEINNSHFIVERKYENEGFQDVGKVDAQGESVEIVEYQFDDLDIERNGNYYYRLRQVDMDGTYDYSPIVVINVKRKGEFNVDIYPNPVYKELYVSIESSEDTDLQAVILDVTGKLMMDNVFQSEIPEGKSEIKFLLDDLPTGTYILRIASEANVVNHKIMVLDK